MAKGEKKGIPKIVIIIIVVVVILLGAGFFLMNNPTLQKGLDMGTGGKYSSIKDALTKSVSLECEYTDPEGASSHVWVKNGAIRADMTGGDTESNGSTIIKDKKMYFWNEKGGYVVTIPDVTPVEGMEDASTDNQSEDFLKDLEEYKENCKPAVVSDSLFSVPTDIEFQDMSKIIENFAPPSGGNEAGYSEEEMKKLIEQYSGENAVDE